MPRHYTMADLVEACKDHCDMENDDSISAAGWLRRISRVYGELCSEVSLGAASRYFETSTTITADGSTSYDEPTDHFSTVRVVEVLDDGRERPLREIEPHEEAAYRGHEGTAVGWILIDDQLHLCPAPSTGSYKWYYVGQPVDLRDYADDDVVDVFSPAGEAFMLEGVAVLAGGKGGKNVQLALTEKEKARERLQFEASQRNIASSPSRGPVDDDDDEYRPPRWDE